LGKIPILFEFVEVQVDPITHQVKRSTRAKVTLYDVSVKVQDGPIPLVLGVEMRRIVLIVIHPDYDPEES
jgi:hypothetical protein